MALHRFKPTNYHHQFETMVQYYMFNAYLNAHSCHYEDVIVARKGKEYVPKLSSYMDKLAMPEMYNKQAAQEEPEAHYNELRLVNEQPRASPSTTPA